MTDTYDRPHFLLLNGGLGRATPSSSEKLASLLKAPPCPRCSATMWLVRLEPHPAAAGGMDDMIYECGCGEQVTRTVDAP